MPKLLILIPPVLSARISDAVNFGGHTSKAALIRHAISDYLDEREKAWAAHRARRDAFHIQRHSLEANPN